MKVATCVISRFESSINMWKLFFHNLCNFWHFQHFASYCRPHMTVVIPNADLAYRTCHRWRQQILFYRLLLSSFACKINCRKCLCHRSLHSFCATFELVVTCHLLCLHVSWHCVQPDPGSHYTAWSSMGTLINKGLVERVSCPAKLV